MRFDLRMIVGGGCPTLAIDCLRNPRQHRHEYRRNAKSADWGRYPIEDRQNDRREI